MKALGIAFLKAIAQIVGSVVAAFLLATWAWSAEPPATATTAPKQIEGSHACQSGETWTLGSSIPQDYSESFTQFLHKKLLTVRSFAEALDLRRKATAPEQKFFAEYWVSRSLYGARMVHIAREGFSVLASRPVTEMTAGVQLEALECLTQINLRYPAVGIEPKVASRLGEYIAPAQKLGKSWIVWDVVTMHLLNSAISGDMTPAELQKSLGYLQGSTAHLALVQGFLSAQKSDHSGAITNLRKFLAASDQTLALRRYIDTAHILMARSLYGVGQYEAAQTQFKLVSKGSNELANALQELTWAYLMDEKYPEAIGTAMNLQAGGLRHTFAPEAPMVMAMAMNELCQYPDSVKAANVFRKHYEKPFKWLDNWKKTGQSQNLYKLAIQYLRKAGNTPDRIASEWVRSPLFISNQEEINLLFDEKDASKQLTRLGSSEQNKLAENILKELADLKPRFYKAKAKMQPGESLPVGIRNDLANLKSDLLHFRRLQRAAPVWKTVLTSYQQKAGPLEQRLARDIEVDLKSRTGRMFDQLEEIAENIQLIEVEIYNGASEDIIWQNAHPDFQKVARDLADPKDKPSGAKVWDWGHATASSDDDSNGGEIWEDELGSFKADLVDNCSSKDRYLALKLNRRSAKN